MCCSRLWMELGAVLAGLGVVLGAYAAHGLDQKLAEKYGSETREVAGQTVPAAQKYLTDFKTGTDYQMYHALGLIAVGLMGQHVRRRGFLPFAGVCFVLGILLFSGSLYIIALKGAEWQGVTWGLVAPFGGSAFILGWLAMAIGACGCGKACSPDAPANN